MAEAEKTEVTEPEAVPSVLESLREVMSAGDDKDKETTEETTDADEPADDADPDASVDAAASDSEETGEEEPDGGAASPDDDEGGEATDDETEEVIEPPTSFDADAKTEFQTWPVEAQRQVSKRLGDMESEFTRTSQENAANRTTANAFDSALKPWQPYLQHLGLNDSEGIAKSLTVLLAAEYRLRSGSQDQKQAILAQFAKDYGVDLQALSERAEDQGHSEPDDEITKVRKGLDTLKTSVEGFMDEGKARAAQEAQGHMDQQVKVFSEAKDDQGELLRPHFNDVRTDMADLIELNEAQRKRNSDVPEMDMDTAYEQAVWANPATRQKMIEAGKAPSPGNGEPSKPASGEAAQAANREARQKKAKAARRASKGTPGRPTKAAEPVTELAPNDIRGYITEAKKQLESSP